MPAPLSQPAIHAMGCFIVRTAVLPPTVPALTGQRPMSLSRQFVPKTVSDYDQEEAVVQSAMAGRLLNSGLPCRLTPEGQARAHRELADIRYRRVAAVIMGRG